MTKNFISIIVGAIIIVSVGGLVYKNKQDSINNSGSLNQAGESTSPSVDTSQGSGYSNKDDFDDDEYDDDDKGTPSSAPVGSKTPTQVTQGSNSSGITMVDVSTHNSKSSCWSAINGSVYDLTSWIPNHPGGERAILSLCGIDGSSAFNNQHGNSSKVLSVLAGFKIGILSK